MASDVSIPNTLSEQDKQAIFQAIVQIFAEFELVYHNQYSKAFPTEEKLTYAKRLWYSHLSHLKPEQILSAAHQAIRESEFLPTIKTILKHCDRLLGLPDAHAAYQEACSATSPRNEYTWSHPAVYHAGRESDWFFLSSNPETKAFPVFKRHYQRLCEQVMNGEELQLPQTQALPEEIHQPLSNAERKERLQTLRKELDL